MLRMDEDRNKESVDIHLIPVTRVGGSPKSVKRRCSCENIVTEEVGVKSFKANHSSSENCKKVTMDNIDSTTCNEHENSKTSLSTQNNIENCSAGPSITDNANQAYRNEASSTSSSSSITLESSSESDSSYQRPLIMRFSPLSFEDNHNNNTISDNFDTDDSDSSENGIDNQGGSTQERVPEVWKKTVSSQTFCFPRELMKRQFRGDDPKRRCAFKFESDVYCSRSMVQRLRLYKSLQKHSGCVNSVTFNDRGDILISGSDDRHVCLWDWARNKSLLYFESGHSSNVFEAKFLPYSGDTCMITCGADSQIRMSMFDQCGLKGTRLIVKHDRNVHRIALQRQMANTFLSAGEDGVVYSIDIRESRSYCHKLLKIVNARSKHTHPVNLYSVHCNPLKNHEFIVSGNDKEVRLYDQRKISRNHTSPVKLFCPTAGRTPVHSTEGSHQKQRVMKSVTSALFNHNGSEVVASYSDNNIYLFDTYSAEEVHHYDGHRNTDSIKRVNFYGPRSEYIVSGSDCGYVYMWDKNSEAIVQWMKGDDTIVNCVESHPSFPILATSGIESDVKIWMPLGERTTNIRDSREFQKITKKNNSYKYANRLRYPGQWAVLSSNILADDIAPFDFERSRERYETVVRELLNRDEDLLNYSDWTSSEEHDDDDDV